MAVTFAPMPREVQQVPREGWWIADVEPAPETFAAAVRRLRQALPPPPGEFEVTQAELARRMGVNPGVIAGYENGRYHPKAPMMRILAETLGTDFAFLQALRRADKERKDYPPDPLPGPGIAVPDVPVMRDLLVTLVELTDDDLRDIAEFAQGRAKGSPAAPVVRSRRTG